LTETQLLTPQDIEIQKIIAERSAYKERINHRLVITPHIFPELKSFKDFFNKLDWDTAIGLHYNCQNKIKTCMKCGEIMPIGCSLSSHNKRCGIIKIYDENGKLNRDKLNEFKRIQRNNRSNRK
jgi:hypothetical protein